MSVRIEISLVPLPSPSTLWSGMFEAVLIAPAVAAGEDVFDTFVCFEIPGLRGPVRCETSAVHVLHLAAFQSFAVQRGHF